MKARGSGRAERSFIYNRRFAWKAAYGVLPDDRAAHTFRRIPLFDNHVMGLRFLSASFSSAFWRWSQHCASHRSG